MSQNTFQFQGHYYKQIEGTAMGDPLSCFVANLFLSYFEINAKSVMDYFPRVWIRYIDDVFAIFNKEENLQAFVDKLNSFYPTIKFTYETEENEKLPFLDILISKNSLTKLIEYDIYRKPTQNYRYIPNDSFHPPAQKRAVFNSLIHRLFNSHLSQDNFNKEVKVIKDIATFNGYKTSLIDNMVCKKRKRLLKESKTTLKKARKEECQWKTFTYSYLAKPIKKSFHKQANINIAFSTKRKLKHILGNPKDKVPNEEKSGIYQIDCDDCDLKYIGQTKRNLKTRLKEHKANFKNNHEEKSAIAKHCIQEQHTFTNVKLLQEVRKSSYLDAYETLHIKRQKEHLVNNEPGIFQSSPFLYLV